MGAESGHAPNRYYGDQAGNLHLNGASLFDASENDVKNIASGVLAGYKIARGVAAITGSGDVVTGLTTVVAVIATLQSDAALTGTDVTATIGNQAGLPAAGSVTIKVWKPTGAGDCTPIAATIAKSVNWIAIGT